jgi:hypothetical protein
VDLTDAILTEHAGLRIAKRQRQVLDSPEEVQRVREGRVVAQAMIGEHLLRVFVDVDRTPPEIVTAYRTSQIDKYRSPP